MSGPDLSVEIGKQEKGGPPSSDLQATSAETDGCKRTQDDSVQKAEDLQLRIKCPVSHTQKSGLLTFMWKSKARDTDK